MLHQNTLICKNCSMARKENLNCGYIDKINWKGRGFSFGQGELISLECPRSLYNRNTHQVDYLLMITSKYFDRSGLNYLENAGAIDTINIIKSINDKLAKEARDKNK